MDGTRGRHADPVERRYYERLRRMTGDERLRIALDLCRTGWRMAEAAVRNQHPRAGEEEIAALLADRHHA